jgi:6-phosphogluconolactonase
MDKVEIKHFDNADQLAQAAAADWLKELAARAGDGARYCVALSGGRIARVFFSAVAELAKSLPGIMAPVHFFWGDERCVPPNDPESNFRLARECLLEPLGIPANQIHRVRGEDAPEVGASEAEAELLRVAPHFSSPRSSPQDAFTQHATRNTPTVQPVLDLVFLGMGEDGHTASLFPGESEETMASPAVFRAVVGPKPPPNRITLGYGVLAAARRVWVLASGSGKEQALRESLAPDGQTPLARVLKLRKQTTIFTDLTVAGW